MKAVFVSLALLAVPSSQLLGWGDDGHKAIWDLAQSRLTPEAKKRVDAILGGDRLEMTSVWMDRVRDVAKGKGGELEGDPDAIAFNTNFKYNATWHYVDLPLGAKSYEEARAFHGYDNVVKQIVFTMKILEGKASDMDQKTALRVLVHLVGDIHQPMHCSSGFFDITDMQKPVLKTDPAECLELDKKKCGDQGGNLVFFGPDKFDQLHSYWDSDTVKRAGLLIDLKVVLGRFIDLVDAKTPGQPEDWPAYWATESVKLAAKAYEGLEFGPASPPTDQGAKGPIGRIEVKLPANYAEFSKRAAAEQMTKAAIRLADVLNAILK